MRRFAIALTLLAVLPAAPGFSETPLGTSFAYQGYLADDQGAPENGVFDFRFILYDAAVGGNQVGPIVTRGDVTVTEGRFNVSLDFGVTAFTGYRRWVETLVRPGDSTGTYDTVLPRQELKPNPHSLWSSTTPWSGISGKPAGFADGVDDDTTYAAGSGLLMEDNVIRIAPDGITTTMIQDGQVDVTDLWLPGVDARYVNETQLRAGVDPTPAMCNGWEAVVFSTPWFSSPPAVVISPDDVSGTISPPNTYCVLNGVKYNGFEYCCFGTTPNYIRWIAVAVN